MGDDTVRARLDQAIDALDNTQRQRLLDWAGSISASVNGGRAAGSSIGPLAEMLHITNEGVDGGHARYRLDVTPEMLNPHGVLHGGAVYVMVDYSMGGATMAQHWEKVEVHEKDASDKRGIYAKGLGLKEELLAEPPWDFVTIQQASIKSHNTGRLVSSFPRHLSRLASPMSPMKSVPSPAMMWNE